MAAGQGFKTFATGDVLSAADVNGYLMQGVLVFADSAERDAEITSPEEGQFAYLKDTNVTTYYTGSVWANLDTTGMTNPMTTTGDTIYSSSGSTPARLGIGSTGQVLTVAGGVPTWSTPGGSSVSGVSLYVGSQSMPNGAITNFTGFTEDYDSASFYTSGTDITIPSAGKYLIQYSVFFAPNASGYRTMGIKKNASTLLETDYGNATAQSFNQPNGVMIRAFTFAASDVLKFYTYQNSGVSLTARAFVTITYLGA